MPSLREHFQAVSALRDTLLKRRMPDNDSSQWPEADPDLDRLTRMAGETAFSEAYNAEQKRILSAFTAQLAAIPDLDRLAARWPYLRRDEQKACLGHFAAVLAAVQSGSGFPVRAAALEWRAIEKSDNLDSVANASLADRTGAKDLIELGASCRNGTRTLSEALEKLVHEQTHIYQISLARALLFGAIDDTHPLHDDAVLAVFTYAGNYIPVELNSAYRAQCVEQDAYRAGEAVESFMKAAFDRTRTPALHMGRIAAGLAVAGLACVTGAVLARRLA